jgi:hypothetical protein
MWCRLFRSGLTSRSGPTPTHKVPAPILRYLYAAGPLWAWEEILKELS